MLAQSLLTPYRLLALVTPESYLGHERRVAVFRRIAFMPNIPEPMDGHIHLEVECLVLWQIGHRPGTGHVQQVASTRKL